MPAAAAACTGFLFSGATAAVGFAAVVALGLVALTLLLSRRRGGAANGLADGRELDALARVRPASAARPALQTVAQQHAAARVLSRNHGRDPCGARRTPAAPVPCRLAGTRLWCAADDATIAAATAAVR